MIRICLVLLEDVEAQKLFSRTRIASTAWQQILPHSPAHVRLSAGPAAQVSRRRRHPQALSMDRISHSFSFVIINLYEVHDCSAACWNMTLRPLATRRRAHRDATACAGEPRWRDTPSEKEEAAPRDAWSGGGSILQPEGEEEEAEATARPGRAPSSPNTPCPLLPKYPT
jgi:hypothetical protein